VDDEARTIDAGALKLESAREGETHRVTLLGEFDLSGAEPFREEMERIESSDAKRIVIDLSRLDFMDSTGLRLLLEIDMRHRGNSEGARIGYVRPAGEVARLLELTRVDERLDFVD
jgi:anti-sigma B factor antagonist